MQAKPMLGGAQAIESVERDLGDALVRAGRLDARALDRALRVRAGATESLIEILPRLGLVSERDLAEAIAQHLNLPLVGARDYPDLPVLEDRIRARFLRDSHVLPLSTDDDAVVLAMADPFNSFAIDAVRLIAGRAVSPAIAVPAELEAAIERLYGRDQVSATQLVEVGAEADEDTLDADRLKDLASEAPVIRLVNHFISRAIEQRASDIHLEPTDDGLRVRYRVDGVLREVDSPPSRLRAAIVSRVKIMARLNIAERRLPQDGRIKMAVRGVPIDLRVATVPTMHGESVVMRLLNREAVRLDFASILRSLLRHDPDIMMVGEIRDLETAEIAVQAALTGHLVLSTLHTNNAAASITRLLDMGLREFLLTSTVNGAAAQRLVRMLCRHCRQAFHPMPELVSQLGLARYGAGRDVTLYEPKGCPECNGSGYHGRTSIFEVLTVDDAIRRLVLRHAEANELQRVAIESGMRTMYDDGMMKALAGETTVEEVLKVTRDI